MPATSLKVTALLAGLHAAGARARERAEPAERPAGAGAAGHVDEQADEQQHGTEAEQHGSSARGRRRSARRRSRRPWRCSVFSSWSLLMKYGISVVEVLRLLAPSRPGSVTAFLNSPVTRLAVGGDRA